MPVAELPIIEDGDFIELPADLGEAVQVLHDMLWGDYELPVEVFDRWSVGDQKRFVLKSGMDIHNYKDRFLLMEGMR